jgi:hypothetical protein
MRELSKFDYQVGGAGWSYAVMGRELDDNNRWLLMPARVLASCPSSEARDAAYRLLSGACEAPAQG